MTDHAEEHETMRTLPSIGTLLREGMQTPGSPAHDLMMSSLRGHAQTLPFGELAAVAGTFVEFMQEEPKGGETNVDKGEVS